MKKEKNGFEENEYTARIRIKPFRLTWLKQYKGVKSAAAFLDEILDDYIKPNLFNKKK